MYCLIVTDDYSRFTWVFFLATKDETCGILKSFITRIENLVDHKVKMIRCDNRTEFKNREMNQFCEIKCIKRQFSVARTPQQNGVAERRNRTLIEAARTMLADSKLLTTFGQKQLIMLDHLGKFDGKAVEVFFVVYSLNRKAFRVINSRTRIVEGNFHIRFSESTPNVAGTQSNGFAGTTTSDNVGKTRKEAERVKYYILLPLWTADLPFSQDLKSSQDDESKPSSGKKVDEDPKKDSECKDQEKKNNINSTNNVTTVSSAVIATGTNENVKLQDDPNMHALEDISTFDFTNDDEDDDIVANMNNLDTLIQVSLIPTIRIHKDHPLDQVIRDLHSATQTRQMSKNLEEHGFEEPKNVIHALKDPSWIEAMQEDLLQLKIKKDERGIVIRNKARLIAQGYIQEEEIDYDEFFAHVARIEAIRLFLAYASFKDFVVYQMDVKSAFLYGKIEKKVYVCQPPGFENPDFPDRVYIVEKALYRLHQAPRAWYVALLTYLLDNRFQRGKIDKNIFIRRHKGDMLLVQVYVDDIIFGLQVNQKKDGIFISQDKYVGKILKKFRFTEVKTASTPMKTQKPLLKDEHGVEVDVHIYRSIIGSLIYLTSSRPNIMFAVCAYARYQFNPKASHLHVVKRIFRYLKGQPKLSLWYLKDSPFDMVPYTDSDYAGARFDKKSTTGGF
uniref:Integrase catalytic domain-containing protein n=1 Tax=Tanacetum cinerariifolium TaxID=118510 RepID=A0A6L2N0U2_TANCI|nr:hypothetical protein [Tanacetum cinerariifolium]